MELVAQKGLQSPTNLKWVMSKKDFLTVFNLFFLMPSPQHFIRSGEEVPAAKPSWSYERESSHCWGEEQTFCLSCGGEESWPHSEVGREI